MQKTLERKGIDIGYKAPYKEVDLLSFRQVRVGMDLAREFTHAVSDLVPHSEFNLGNHQEDGEVAFRFIRLPDDPEGRARKVQKIADRGSDRTNLWQFTNWSLDLFAQTGLVGTILRPNDYFYAIGSKRMFRSSIEAMCGHLDANALVIFDAVTPRGVSPCSKPDAYPQIFTFEDPSNKHLALLAIVGFGNLDSQSVSPAANLSLDNPLMQSIAQGR